VSDVPVTMDTLGSVPYYVVAGYMLLLLGLGIAGWRKSVNNEEDYYLAGRGQGWIVSSLTIMATFFSSFALLGAPGMVYRDGVVFALFSLNVPLSGAAVYFFGSKIRRIGQARGYVTPGDMVSDYYGSPVALRLLVALVGLLYTIPYVVMQIQAGGILSQQLFPGENSYEVGAVVLAIITMAYIMIGGMRSVAWTDVVQGILLMGGMLVGGAAVVAVLGGPVEFFNKVAELPAKSLSVPGTSGFWTPAMLLTVCLIGSIGSLVQPAQWMRFYAAKSTKTLKRSALIFAVLLTGCFLFGVMLVGLGGQVLYPIVDGAGEYYRSASGALLPNPAVGTTPGGFNDIMLVVLKNHLPELLGGLGALVASLIMVAIMAAAMSTADSNLHAMSAVVTRDIYDRFIRPAAGGNERTWVGRAIISVVTIASLGLVIVANRSETNPLGMIVILGLFAIAFSSQLLPITFDMLYLRKGTKQGAIAGMVTGLAIVFFISPFMPEMGEGWGGIRTAMLGMIDKGSWGVIGNVVVFVVVSALTQPLKTEDVAEFSRLADGE